VCAAATSTASTTTSARDGAARRRCALGNGARSTERAVVLTIAVDPIRNLIVDRDVIHLRDRQRHVLERATVIRREPSGRVIREAEVIGILRIDPDVVIVTAPRDFDE